MYGTGWIGRSIVWRQNAVGDQGTQGKLACLGDITELKSATGLKVGINQTR